MKPVVKVALLCLIVVVALFIRSEYIRKDGKYLLGADPYYHYRMAETILTQGERPEWDSLGCWPTGNPVSYPPLFQYYLAYSYKFIGAPLGLDLFQWCIYASIIPLVFCVILMFFTGAALTNDYGGLLAAALFATMPAITIRTVIGFTDTDSFVLLLSLIVLSFFVLTVTYKGKNNPFLQPVFAFICGFALFLFSKTWAGYWYMLSLVSAVFVVWIFLKREKNRLESFVAFLTGFCSFFALFESAYLESLLLLGVFLLYEYSLHRMKIQSKIQVAPAVVLIALSAWVIYSLGVISPLLYLLPFTLAPESDALTYSYTQMIVDNFVMTPKLAWDLLGPSLILAPLGIVLLKRQKVWLSAFLIFYLAGTALMLLRGGRFSLLMGIPLCLGSVIFVFELAKRLDVKSKEYTKPVIAFICIVLISVQAVQSEKVNSGPQFMNDDLWNALQWIEATTPEDSVVIGHWGMGYFIESVSKRHSVMNGTQYDLFWRLVKFGTILTTENEEIAVKEVYGFSTPSEIEDMRIFSKDPDLAQQQIREEMTPFAESDAYLLIDGYTALTLGWWSQYGTWNYSTQKGRQFYYNVAFLTTGRKQAEITEYKYQGGQDLIFLYKSEDGFHSFVYQRGLPMPTRGTIFTKEGREYYFVREEGVYGVIFLPYTEEKHEGEDPIFQYMSTYIIGIPQSLEEILLTNFYFLDGDGLVYFELVKEIGTVKVYKVHKTPHEDLNEGPIREVDEFTLIATPA